MSQSYHQQFRENRRNNNHQNGSLVNSKATAGSKLPPQRSTVAAKQASRSDTFTLPAIRNETKSKAPKTNQIQNGSRRETTKKSAPIKQTPPVEQNRTEDMRRNVVNRPIMKQINPILERGNLERKPVRFANNYNNAYSAPPASLPAYQQKPSYRDEPLPQDNYDRSRRIRVANDDYVAHRRAESPTYAYNDDYNTVSDMPTISYFTTSLPPIVHPSKRQTPPTVIIRPKENHHSRPSTHMPTVSIAPPHPIMILPSVTAPSYPPNSNIPSLSPMALPMTTMPSQSSVQSFFLQPSLNPSYIPQSFFYPIHQTNPNVSSSAPPLPSQTIISQTASSSVSAPPPPPAQVKTDEKTTTFIVRPDTTNKKNVTIQVKMIDEDSSLDRRAQRVRRVIRDPPYYESEDRYYTESEPKRVIYEQPRHRRRIIRRAKPPPPPPPVTEYVYDDDDEPTPRVIRRRAPRSEIVYVDDDPASEYEEEVIYVDEDGNEVDYIYDDEPAYHRRNHVKSRYPPPTKIVYE